MEGCQKNDWNIYAAEDVEMCEPGLGNTDQLDDGCLGRSIQCLAIPEQFNDECWQMRFTQADDSIVDYHEQCKEYEDCPHNIEVIV